MINVAIIGTGNIAHSHIEGYLDLADRCQITALVNLDASQAEQYKTHYQLTAATVYTDYHDVLDDPTIDLVSICLPPTLHAKLSIEFLLHGKNVICEKPMAPSLAECDQMIAAQKQSGKRLSIIAQNRYQDPIWRLKQVLDAGLIGRVLHVQVDSFWWRGHVYYDKAWRGTWHSEGGGATLSQAVHNIDMLAWLMGDPAQVTAVLSNTAHNNAEVEDLSVAILKYPDQALAQITSSTIHHGQHRQLIFQGEKARISSPWLVEAELSGSDGFPLASGNKALIQQIQDFYDAVPPLKYTLYAGQFDNVLTCLEQGGTPLSDGEAGKKTIELITAIYEAGSLERTINWPLKPTDPFYTSKGKEANVPYFN